MRLAVVSLCGLFICIIFVSLRRKTHPLSLLCSFDNAEVYADGKAETVMGQAIKVRLPKFRPVRVCHCAKKRGLTHVCQLV